MYQPPRNAPRHVKLKISKGLIIQSLTNMLTLYNAPGEKKKWGIPWGNSDTRTKDFAGFIWFTFKIKTMPSKKKKNPTGILFPSPDRSFSLGRNVELKRIRNEDEFLRLLKREEDLSSRQQKGFIF